MNLFDQNNEITPQLDATKNYLEDLVGEGKKFKTVEDLARGKAEADLYIETLNRRSDELREDYLKIREEATAQAKLQDLIDRLEGTNTRQIPQPPVENLERKPEFDPTKLPSLIKEEIRRDRAEEKASSNFTQVQNKLKEQFGSNFQTILQDKMNSLDLTVEDINSLARKSPTAFFNTLGLNQQSPESLSPMPRSSTNTAGFKPQTKEKRTWSYYENLRKSNPKMYYDPKIANQMHDDAIAMGDEFQDGDFHA
jgi:hypothetical protein